MKINGMGQQSFAANKTQRQQNPAFGTRRLDVILPEKATARKYFADAEAGTASKFLEFVKTTQDLINKIGKRKDTVEFRIYEPLTVKPNGEIDSKAMSIALVRRKVDVTHTQHEKKPEIKGQKQMVALKTFAGSFTPETLAEKINGLEAEHKRKLGINLNNHNPETVKAHKAEKADAEAAKEIDEKF